MTDKEILKKQIIYRSTHRGSKEMDILLGSFIKENIENFNVEDLRDAEKILFIEDEILYQWYFDKTDSKSVPNNRISRMLKEYKI